jgi:hypothetical protein
MPSADQSLLKPLEQDAARADDRHRREGHQTPCTSERRRNIRAIANHRREEDERDQIAHRHINCLTPTS